MTDMTSEQLTQLIQNILELRIRPVLQAHGGDIAFKAFKDGILWVELQGACNGCPGALNTLKGNVEHFMKLIVPQIKEVKDIHLEVLQQSVEDES